jgi:hypothetical protein
MKTRERSRVLDPDQAAEMLCVSKRWLLREGVRKYRVPYLRPSGSRQYKFLESDLWAVLDSWRASERVGTPPKKSGKKPRKSA